MTKVKKIICDICLHEIDVNSGMSLYESVSVQKTSVFKPGTVPELQKISLDFCLNCSEKIEKYIKELNTNCIK